MGLNPNGPISQVDIEHEIIRLTAVLEEETERYAVLIEDASKKESRYKAEFAKAYLNAQGSIEERRQWSEYQCADESYSYRIADALAKASKESMNSIRTNLSALQTLAANIRAQT